MKKIAVVAIQHQTEPNLFLHGLRTDNQKWACAGGHASPGETDHEAASRELEEETGLKGIKLDKVHEKVYGQNHVVLFHGMHPADQELDAKADPDKEFVTFKFLDPTTHENLHVPTKHNIISDWLKQSLKKDQPQIKFPKVPDIPTRLDQEVRSLPPGQTASAKRKRNIGIKSYLSRLSHATGIPTQPYHAADTKTMVNKIGNSYQSRVKGAKSVTPGAVTVPAFRHSEPMYGQQAGYYSSEFQGIHPGRSIQEHEAAHMLMNHVAKRYGEDAKDKVVEHALAHFHVDDRNAMFRALSGSRAYRMSPAIKEEMMNHMRDYLTDPMRRQYLDKMAGKAGAKLDHNRMKTSWKNAISYLKNVTPEWLKSQESEHHAIQNKANELKPSVAFQQPEKLAASAGKIKVEPFTTDPSSFNPRKHDFIVRYQHRGKQVGSLYVTHKKDGIMPFEFQVKPSMQRKGIGTAMAMHAQKLSGKKIIRSPDMSEAGRGFAEKFIGPIKPVRKSEELEKMGAMRRLAPFNPRAVQESEREKAGSWMQEANRESRDKLKDLQDVAPEAKKRALHQLSSKTSVRVNPDTQEREFLLHRGPGPIEAREYRDNGKTDGMTSWTPDKRLAISFGSDHWNSTQRGAESKDYFNEIGVDPITAPHLASAWIPESQIHHAPRMIEPRFGDSDETYSNEHEIIVKPHKLKDMQLTPNPGDTIGTAGPPIKVDQMINMRGAGQSDWKTHPLLPKYRASLRAKLGKDEQPMPQPPVPLVLQIPVSFHGKSTKMTVKNFGDMNSIDHQTIQSTIDGQKFHEPIDASKMIFKPHALKGVDGRETHVLLVYGAPNKIMNMKGSTPYIQIDKDDYEKFRKLGPALTSEATGIKFHPAELKAGDQVLKTY